MDFKIKKGLDICIPGAAKAVASDMLSARTYAVKPTDYVGIDPRLLVAEGDSIMAGEPLFVDKHNEAARFASPVSGTVKAIVRGEKRKLLAVVVEQDPSVEPQRKFVPEQLDGIDREKIVDAMIANGLWTLIKERPFGIVPLRSSKPKAVFVSAFDSSPLPVDYQFMLQQDDFEKGIEILHHLVGKVHLSLQAGKDKSFLDNVKGAEIHHFAGPHPAGLVGTQIAAIDPINKGEAVWTVNAQDVAVIGSFFRTGYYRPERVVALCGPTVKEPKYYRVMAGVSIAELTNASNFTALHSPHTTLRFISGDVLSGTAVAADGFISARCDKLSVLPEGDYYDFLGWLRPNFKKFSFSRTFLSGFFKRRTGNGERRTESRFFTFDTGRHGSVRPLFVTGEFEKLVPLDIYPMQLIKACIAGNIEQMEKLGIYEVEPEDLALCEFADTSKTEIQAIIREGLEKIRKEG